MNKIPRQNVFFSSCDLQHYYRPILQASLITNENCYRHLGLQNSIYFLTISFAFKCGLLNYRAWITIACEKSWRAVVATQLAERSLPIPEVRGSNPVKKFMTLTPALYKSIVFLIILLILVNSGWRMIKLLINQWLIWWNVVAGAKQTVLPKSL